MNKPVIEDIILTEKQMKELDSKLRKLHVQPSRIKIIRAYCGGLIRK